MLQQDTSNFCASNLLLVSSTVQVVVLKPYLGVLSLWQGAQDLPCLTLQDGARDRYSRDGAEKQKIQPGGAKEGGDRATRACICTPRIEAPVVFQKSGKLSCCTNGRWADRTVVRLNAKLLTCCNRRLHSIHRSRATCRRHSSRGRHSSSNSSSRPLRAQARSSKKLHLTSPARTARRSGSAQSCCCFLHANCRCCTAP